MLNPAVESILAILVNPNSINSIDRVVAANAIQILLDERNKPVHVLTRSGEQGILGVYRTKEAAEEARDQYYYPDEMVIEVVIVEDEYSE